VLYHIPMSVGIHPVYAA